MCRQSKAFRDEARRLIAEYTQREFGYELQDSDGADGVYAIGHTTDGNGEHEFNFYADVNKLEIIFQIDGKTVATEGHVSCWQFIDTLENLRLEMLTFPLDCALETILDSDCEFIAHWDSIYHLLAIERMQYAKGGLALGLVEATDFGLEPYQRPFTVNLLEYKTKSNCAYVDVNNAPWIQLLIKAHRLGEFTYGIGFSGWCTYPEYKFDLEAISKYELKGE